MLQRFVREDNGMKMVEWAIVGIVFALGGVVVWLGLNGQIQAALTAIGSVANGQTPGH